MLLIVSVETPREFRESLSEGDRLCLSGNPSPVERQSEQALRGAKAGQSGSFGSVSPQGEIVNLDNDDLP